ncbi:MAG: DUF4956 domain-containing protein [Clostridia bacterium]|nr:DUF4956 domain-containing protein [Clostridia bacterium]
MNIFASLFEDTTSVSVTNFFIVMAVALGAGIIYSFLCYFKGKSSKSFLITTALVPAAVAMVIMLVNGNIGVGVAVAGAFGLVRFRSAQGSAKEILIIFIAMAAGLAFGTGYLAYGAIFLVLAGIILLVLNLTKIWEKKSDKSTKLMKVTIPEDLDYVSVFDDLFEQYTKDAELVKTKSVNMGSMFRLTYKLTLKDPSQEKKFIDDIRCRNGNLEIVMERYIEETSML